MPILQIKVRTGARSSVLEQCADGSFVAKLKAQPVDGKANAELIKLVADRLGVSKSSVSIKLGASARLKLISVNE